ASAPFDARSADIVVRSVDHVDFLMYRSVLVLVSTMFQNMFNFPQPTTLSAEDIHPDSGLPLVCVTEDSQTLDRLFRMCCLIYDPEPLDLAEIVSMLEAATKYGMERALVQASGTLHLALAREPPARIYTIACRFMLESVARAAAVASTKCDKLDYIPEMDHVSAGALHRLLQFRRSKAAEPDAEFTFCEPQAETFSESAVDDAEHIRTGSSVIFHPFSHPSADLVLESSDGVEFYVHQFTMSMASDVLANMILLARADNVSQDGRLVLSLADDSRTLLRVLQFCYPMADPEIEDMAAGCTFLEAAIKYRVERAVAYALGKWTEQIEAQPFRAYFIAMRYQLIEDQVAQEATIHAIGKTHDPYVREMEDVPAHIYRRFFEYR
ncbi:hypothetical protein B0H21DRAFT_675811, partial [Amylocystis lapponica]